MMSSETELILYQLFEAGSYVFVLFFAFPAVRISAA